MKRKNQQQINKQRQADTRIFVDVVFVFVFDFIKFMFQMIRPTDRPTNRPTARHSSGLFLNIEVYVNISWPATQTKTETEKECLAGGRGGEWVENTIIFDIDKRAKKMMK